MDRGELIYEAGTEIRCQNGHLWAVLGEDVHIHDQCDVRIFRMAMNQSRPYIGQPIERVRCRACGGLIFRASQNGCADFINAIIQ